MFYVCHLLDSNLQLRLWQGKLCDIFIYCYLQLVYHDATVTNK